ncbi:hypothetical protein A2841_03815 [Candidatus Kaiserbacteria bacterium RIFCSPHIGHO2_01_FULL_48_10]|uniref:Leucine-binding protein domain-containing protein n=1 Tax=Candidatus Kaiserbacteria bacterium RIFCSPHIGHO2_01_FULL_48_10 TaxID=1798476 RepID=A0A1F6C2A4_9BACT|nr:MAG: hypothetical protein A2841_03815 [Candidatus Kaiserbacteria bacterium RIFCSPHIGHO2_01_FULL_48_10]
MKNLWLWMVVAIVLIGGYFVFFSKPSDVAGETVKIGAALALSGDAAPWGEVSRNAAQLAVDEINQGGGINGKQVILAVEDTKSSSKDSVTAVSKLVNVDKVQAVMITWLDSYPGAESVMPVNMPLVSQDAAIESVNVPVNHPNVFSLWYRTAAKAESVLGAMAQEQVKTAYIVTQNDSYYATLNSFLKKEAGKQGIAIIAAESLNPSDDARTVVAKIKSLKPDAVFFGSYDDKLSVNFIKSYRDIIGYSIPFYGDEFIEQDFMGKSFNPAWFEGITYYVPADPNKAFAEKYMARFGVGPKFSAGTTYDTVKILAKYLADMPSDTAAYMKGMSFNTVTYGKISFDEIGGVVTDRTGIAIKRISGGKIVSIPL